MTRKDPLPLSAAHPDRASVKESPKTGPADTRRNAADSGSLRSVDDGSEPVPGDLPHSSVDLTTADPSSAPTMPHERDETSGMTDGIPSERVQQAFDDVEAGRQDTSRAPEADRAYRQQKGTG